MKKIKPLLMAGIALLTFGLTSCETPVEINQQDVVQTNIENYLVKKLHAPESYEFGELRLKDSVLYKDNIQYHKSYYTRNLKADKANLEKQHQYKEKNSSMYDEIKETELIAEIYKYENILKEIDRISADLGDKSNEVASYRYYYRFKSENTTGATSEYTYVVQTKPGPDFKIIELVQNEDQALLHPNDFPGYDEMIQNYN